MLTITGDKIKRGFKTNLRSKGHHIGGGKRLIVACRKFCLMVEALRFVWQDRHAL